MNLYKGLQNLKNHTTVIASPIDQNDIYEYIYGDLPSRASYYAIVFLVVTVGTFLSLTIVIYEQFGADPMKRTIINRLYSLVFSNLAVNFWIWGTLRVLRDIFGLLPSQKLTWVFCIAQSIGLSSFLFTTELTIFRYLYIVMWKGVRQINDDFWAKFLALSTYSISLYSCIVAHFCGRGSPWDQGQIIDIKDNGSFYK